MRHRHLRTPKLMSLIPLLALLILAAVACGASATPTSAPPAAAPAPVTAPTAAAIPALPAGLPPTNNPVPLATSVAAAAPLQRAKAGGAVNMGAYADPETWDPLGAASVFSVQAFSQLFSQIVMYDTADTNKIRGDLAKSWEVTNGGLTYTFRLNDNIKWQDGKDLTAEDVVFSMERYMNPKVAAGRSGAFREYTKKVEEGGVKLIDSKTVEFNLAFPSGAFLSFLALDYVKVLPKHHLAEVAELKQADPIIQRKAGSGPFQLTEYQRGNSFKVVKNKTYFKPERPYLDGINHYIIVDNSRLIAAFKSSQLDMMSSGFSGLGVTEYLQMEKDMKGAIKLHELPGSRNLGLMMNIKKGPLQDPKVRKAIYLALDRQELIQLQEDGKAGLPTIFMPGFVSTEAEALAWPGIRPKNTPGGQEDLAEAKRLMTEAGYPNGFTTTFDVRQTSNLPDTCSLVKQQLKRTLGIDGEVRTHESAAGYALFATARKAEGNWSLACQGEAMTVLDPDAVFGGVYRVGATRNYPDWTHPKIEDLFERQKNEQDPAKRRALLLEAEPFLRSFDDNHWVTLYWGKYFWPVHRDIRGFNPPQTLQYGFTHEDLWLDR